MRASGRDHHSRWEWMTSNSVACSTTCLTVDGEPAAGVALDARRAQSAASTVGTSRAGTSESPLAKTRDVVAAPDELGRQLVDDPLGPAVRRGRHALERRRDLRDAQAAAEPRSSAQPVVPRARPWMSVDVNSCCIRLGDSARLADDRLRRLRRGPLSPVARPRTGISSATAHGRACPIAAGCVVMRA